MFGYYHNIDSAFIHLDDEITFNHHCKTIPNWEYKHINVRYKFNEFGHRSISPTLLDNDYILFLGCSHTLGIGMASEHLYVDIVSKQLGLPYYNLAAGGCGPDIVVNNTLAFLSFVKKKPIAIVIQWPNFHRFFHINEEHLNVELLNPSSVDSRIWKELSKDNMPELKNWYLRLFLLDVLANMNVTKIHEIFYDDEIPPELDATESSMSTSKSYLPISRPIDLARDRKHPGRLSHENYAQILLSDIRID